MYVVTINFVLKVDVFAQLARSFFKIPEFKFSATNIVKSATIIEDTPIFKSRIFVQVL